MSVQSGSGSIRVEPGAVDSVRVAARLKAGSAWLAGGDVEKRIRRIEQNPPIEQQGNVIRIGWFADDDLPRNISITYEITVPAATRLSARTGSGAILVGAIAGPAEVKSGSGSVTIGRVGAQVTASTGSGSIKVEGAGGLDASTGSGSIERRVRRRAHEGHQRLGEHHDRPVRQGRCDRVGVIRRHQADGCGRCRAPQQLERQHQNRRPALRAVGASRVLGRHYHDHPA